MITYSRIGVRSYQRRGLRIERTPWDAYLRGRADVQAIRRYWID
jgi:hypothetical protein